MEPRYWTTISLPVEIHKKLAERRNFIRQEFPELGNEALKNPSFASVVEFLLDCADVNLEKAKAWKTTSNPRGRPRKSFKERAASHLSRGKLYQGPIFPSELNS